MNSSGTTKTKELEADIVVIGAGGAGLPAAVTAAERGARVTVLEKLRVLGGNALLAHGLFAVESKLQKSVGLNYTTDFFFTRAMEWSHWRPDARLIRTLLERSGETIDWLQENGVKFEQMDPPTNLDVFPFPFIVGKGITGAGIVKVLVKRCQDLDVSILCNTSAKKLLTDEAGRVTGVLADGDGGGVSISTKSVIIATGGFLGNKELMKKYFLPYNEDLYDDIYLVGLPHNGDGLLMATEIGAACDCTVAFEWEGNRFPQSLPLSYLVDDFDMVWLNIMGERFTDESNMAGTNSLYRQPHKTFYAIFDENIKQHVYAVASNRSLHRIVPAKADEELRVHGEKSMVKISDSWDEIAEWMGLSPEVLKATINEYNSCCDQGYDPVFLKKPKHLVPLSHPPYYAVKCCLSMILTRGPLRINPSMEVINKNYAPIPGLYAAGVDIGGTDSDVYCGDLPGHSFGFAIVSGHIAGGNAVRFVEGLKGQM